MSLETSDSEQSGMHPRHRLEFAVGQDSAHAARLHRQVLSRHPEGQIWFGFVSHISLSPEGDRIRVNFACAQFVFFVEAKTLRFTHQKWPADSASNFAR